MIASVSKFDVGAEICFDLARLSTLPRESLDAALFGIVAHEVSHIFEANETEAQAIQNLAAENYGKLFVGDGNTLRHNLFSSMEDALRDTQKAQDELKVGKKTAAIFSLGLASGQLQTLASALSDRLNVGPEYGVKRPELVEVFNKALREALRFIWNAVEKIEAQENQNEVLLNLQKALDHESQARETMIKMFKFRVVNDQVITYEEEVDANP